MEFKHLEIFVHAAKTLSFSKTADDLYLSQPTISACISSLEKFLGSQLFIRNTKGVSLTKIGLIFLSYAQKILSLQEHALSAIRGENRNAHGEISIISSTIPAQHLLPDIIASFNKLWPNITFHLVQSDSKTVEKEMKGFRYDFGMVGTIPHNDRFIRFPIYNDNLVLAIPNNTPHNPDSIRANFADFITRLPFLMRESGSGTRSEIETLFSKIGINLRSLSIPAYFSDTHGILLAVSRGMGVALVPGVAAALFVSAGLLTTIEMNNPLFCRQIYLMYNKELWLSPVQQAFVDHTRNFFR